MRIEKTTGKDLQQLNDIYNAAFDSNPCPENLIADEKDGEEPDLTPEVAMNLPLKTVLSFFEGETLIGGAVLDTSDSTINLLSWLFIAPSYQGKGYGYRAWREIEQNYTTAPYWELRTPIYLFGNVCFYINKCGFALQALRISAKTESGCLSLLKK